MKKLITAFSLALLGTTFAASEAQAIKIVFDVHITDVYGVSSQGVALPADFQQAWEFTDYTVYPPTIGPSTAAHGSVSASHSPMYAAVLAPAGLSAASEAGSFLVQNDGPTDSGYELGRELINE